MIPLLSKVMEQKGSGVSLRVAQEEQVEHWVGLEEVDEGPAENPTTQGEETESGHDQQHILHKWRWARLGGLAGTRGKNEAICCLIKAVIRDHYSRSSLGKQTNRDFQRTMQDRIKQNFSLKLSTKKICTDLIEFLGFAGSERTTKPGCAPRAPVRGNLKGVILSIISLQRLYDFLRTFTFNYNGEHSWRTNTLPGSMDDVHVLQDDANEKRMLPLTCSPQDEIVMTFSYNTLGSFQVFMWLFLFVCLSYVLLWELGLNLTTLSTSFTELSHKVRQSKNG